MGGFIRDVTGVKGAKKAGRTAASQQRDAVGEAASSASGILQERFDPALAALTGGFQGAQDTLSGAQPGIEALLRQGAGDAIGTIGDFSGQSIDALRGAGDIARGDIQAGALQGREDINQAAAGATGALNPFLDVGQQALQQEAALSGALGNEAQAAAFQNFNESPGQKFLREQGEKAALRGASSQGRSLSGSVLAELQNRGTGLAQQDFGNQLARLSSLAGRGQQAGGSIANILQGQGVNLANLSSQEAQQLAQIAQSQGGNIANVLGSQGANIGNIQQGLGQQLAGSQGTLASNLANLQTQQGAGVAGLQGNLGNSLANIALGLGDRQASIAGARGLSEANASLAGGSNLMSAIGTVGGAVAAPFTAGMSLAGPAAISAGAPVGAQALMSGNQAGRGATGALSTFGL
jgi:hypothetical protein